MARTHCRIAASRCLYLEPEQINCWFCGKMMWIAYHTKRTITTLDGSCQLIVSVRRCRNTACPQYHLPYRPEAEGHWALPHGEFGLDIIVFIGRLRYAKHQSIPEIHQVLQERGVSIAERTVTHLLYRYEELVALHVSDQNQLHSRLKEQAQVVLALDGLQPDVGHEVLWVLRDCLSGEVLLARSLLSGCEEDLATLLREVQQTLPVPIKGVISDGQRSIRNAVHAVFPDLPHQLCHFHYLREAAKPVYEADRHAKKELKKHVRGVRPIEREVEKRENSEAEVIRGYCLAVRSALTDDGRPPLAASGLKLYERLSAIAASLMRVSKKVGLPRELERMQVFLAKGLTETAALWPDVQQGYTWVHRAAHILTNAEKQTAAEVRHAYEDLLTEMEQAPISSEALTTMLSTFRKVTTNYWPGLFYCYDMADLPRTNNELEQYFGSARYHERRVTGRKQASPGMVVRGAVRVVASVASRLYSFAGAELYPTDLSRWRALRSELNHRHEARRMQHRFRTSPESYLTALENKLIKESLPT